MIPIAGDGVAVPKSIQPYVQQDDRRGEQSDCETPENTKVSWVRLYSFANVADAALEMHREGRVVVSPKLIATFFVHPAVTYTQRDWPGLFETISETFDGGADQLRQRIRGRLEKIASGNYDDEPQIVVRVKDPHAFLRSNQGFWNAAFEFLGDDTTTTKESLDVLSKLNTATFGDSRIIPEEIQPSLDAAIAKLSAK